MKHKKLTTCAVLLLCLGSQATKAETALFVKQKAGAVTQFTMSELHSLTFTTGNVVVNQRDFKTNFFPLANVQYLNFGENITTKALNENLISEMHVSLMLSMHQNKLLIMLSGEIKERNQLELFDIRGTKIFSTMINNSVRDIYVDGLSQGIYICRFQNGNEIYTQKFIKK